MSGERTEASVAGFYERLWSDTQDRENAARWSFQEELVGRALDRLGQIAGKRVVEVGPGVGRETCYLLDAGATVVAVDVATSSLRRTRDGSGGRAHLVCAAAEHLPLGPGTIDRIFAQTVLMHLDVERSAAEWARVLATDGRVVILEPIAGNPLVALYRRWMSPYRATSPRYVTVAELRGIHPDLELVHDEQHFLVAVLALLAPARLRPAALAVLGPVDRLLFRWAPLRRLAWMTLVELRRR